MEQSSEPSIRELKARRNWLYVCGVMPWNWLNNDIWTAQIMYSRAYEIAKRKKMAALRVQGFIPPKP